MRLCKKNTL